MNCTNSLRAAWPVCLYNIISCSSWNTGVYVWVCVWVIEAWSGSSWCCCIQCSTSQQHTPSQSIRPGKCEQEFLDSVWNYTGCCREHCFAFEWILGVSFSNFWLPLYELCYFLDKCITAAGLTLTGCHISPHCDTNTVYFYLSL